jgi:hypothetical protein
MFRHGVPVPHFRKIKGVGGMVTLLILVSLPLVTTLLALIVTIANIVIYTLVFSSDLSVDIADIVTIIITKINILLKK